MKPERAPLRLLALLLKVAIVSGAVSYLLLHVWRHWNEIELTRFTESLQQHPWLLAAVLLLLPLNWGVEALKWQLLLAPLQRLGFGQALRAVLAGVTVGMATPNRVGESLGRILLLAPGLRAQAVLPAMAGSAAQLVVTAMAAAAGLLLVNNAVQLPALDVPLLVGVGAAVVVLVLVGVWLLRRTQPMQQVLAGVRVLGRVRAARVLGLSALRYAVYAVQFVLLLRAAGITTPVAELGGAVALTYGVITLLPTFAFTEVFVRGSAAATLIGGVSGQPTVALSAAVLLWCINVAVPALLGSWPLVQVRFFTPHHDE